METELLHRLIDVFAEVISHGSWQLCLPLHCLAYYSGFMQFIWIKNIHNFDCQENVIFFLYYKFLKFGCAFFKCEQFPFKSRNRFVYS